MPDERRISSVIVNYEETFGQKAIVSNSIINYEVGVIPSGARISNVIVMVEIEGEAIPPPLALEPEEHIPVDNVIFVFHNETSYDDANLNGNVLESDEISHGFPILVFFEPLEDYDGTVFFEITTELGTSWFEFCCVRSYYRQVSVSNVTSISRVVSYIAYLPTGTRFRTRMSGGTKGKLKSCASLFNIGI